MVFLVNRGSVAGPAGADRRGELNQDVRLAGGRPAWHWRSILWPWRCRSWCSPCRAAWLVSRTGMPLAPAMDLTGAAALTYVGALLMPKEAPYRLTKEFEGARFRPPAASN